MYSDIAEEYGDTYTTLRELKDVVKKSASYNCFAGMSCYTLSVLNHVLGENGLEAIPAGPRAAPRLLKKYGLQRYQPSTA